MILSLETSTKAGSVALHKDGKLIAYNELHLENSHSGSLTPMIMGCLEMADVTLNAIKAVAVACGPGSYTGLRIGASTAKGLCFGADIPLIGVGTLAAMACQVNTFYTGIDEKSILLCPMIDARRMEVYTAVYTTSLAEVVLPQAKIITKDSFTDLLDQHQIIFFGNGAAKCATLISHKNAVFLSKEITPSAKEVGELGFKKFEAAIFEDIAYFEPNYLKDWQLQG
jgi:tRNA threonylcarbamoyladenosine biosynthesis protein TsaB